MENMYIVGGALLLVTAVSAIWKHRSKQQIPEAIRPGKPLPDFHAADESGNPVHSSELHGSAAVILFVRGNWCPFCNSQVKDLSAHYRDIVDLGARLILVTPKPQETTRRVAEFFNIELDFWLDENLEITKKLGLLLESGVPGAHRKEYGADTIRPASLVIDASGLIRFAQVSKNIVDRPDPTLLLSELRTALGQ